MKDWNQLRTFLALADAESFTEGGRATNMSQSNVSRQVAALESRLGVSLFKRHALGVSLTEPGRIVRHAAREMNSRLNLALGQLDDYREVPTGALRIATTLGFGADWLSPRLNTFMDQHPDISVSLILADGPDFDLYDGAADIAVQFGRPTRISLIQKKVMRVHYRIYASPAYLRDHGVPTTAADLDQHRIIVFGDDAPPPMPGINRLLEVGREDGEPRQQALCINSEHGIYQAVQGGVGIGLLPDYLARQAPDLVEVLPELQTPCADAYFVYPEEIRESRRVAVLREFLLSEARIEAGEVDHRVEMMFLLDDDIHRRRSSAGRMASAARNWEHNICLCGAEHDRLS